MSLFSYSHLFFFLALPEICQPKSGIPGLIFVQEVVMHGLCWCVCPLGLQTSSVIWTHMIGLTSYIAFIRKM